MQLYSDRKWQKERDRLVQASDFMLRVDLDLSCPVIWTVKSWLTISVVSPSFDKHLFFHADWWQLLAPAEEEMRASGADGGRNASWLSRCLSVCLCLPSPTFRPPTLTSGQRDWLGRSWRRWGATTSWPCASSKGATSSSLTCWTTSRPWTGTATAPSPWQWTSFASRATAWASFSEHLAVVWCHYPLWHHTGLPFRTNFF